MTSLVAPPTVPLTRRERIMTPAVTIGGLTLLSVALHFRDPHDHASWGLCPSAALGFYCPGCGGLRAVNDLTNGQIGAAYSSNLAFMVLLPFLVVGLAVWAIDRWRGVERHLSPTTMRAVSVTVLVFLATFTVLRNLGVGAWLAP